MSPLTWSSLPALGARLQRLSWRAGWAALRDHFRYHGVLSPGVRVMRQFRFGYKILLVGAAFGVPATHVTSSHLAQQWQAWRVTQRHADAATYLEASQPLATALTLAQAPDATPSNRQRIEVGFDALLAMENDRGIELGTRERWQAFNAELSRVLAASAAVDEKASIALLRQLQATRADLVQRVRMEYVSDAAVHQLVNQATFHLPAAQIALSEAIATLSGLPDTAPEPPALLTLAVAVSRAHDAVRHLAPDAGFPANRLACEADQQRLIGEADRWASAVRAQASGAGGAWPLSAWRADAQRLLGQVNGVQQACAEELTSTLQAVQAQRREDFWMLCLTTGAALAFAVYVVLAFIRVMQGGMHLVQSEVARVARGDLSASNLPRGDDEVAHTLLVLRASLHKLSELFTVVRRGVTSVSHASGEISQATEALADEIQRSTATLDALHKGVRSTVTLLGSHERNVMEAVERARDVTRDAQRSRQTMGHLSEVMGQLQERGHEIGKIVNMIDAIAFQTNLLALNASVEASKAGQSGKGFAVVASEVRNLALRVGDAAQQINAVVSRSTYEIREGLATAEVTLEAVRETQRHADDLSDIMGQLASVSMRSQETAESMIHTIEEVMNKDDRASKLMKQLSHAAFELRHQSLKLADHSGKFKLH
jgi:methyl-accepting chemotaxis protein